jgi:hypothetical protein
VEPTELLPCAVQDDSRTVFRAHMKDRADDIGLFDARDKDNNRLRFDNSKYEADLVGCSNAVSYWGLNKEQRVSYVVAAP